MLKQNITHLLHRRILPFAAFLHCKNAAKYSIPARRTSIPYTKHHDAIQLDCGTITIVYDKNCVVPAPTCRSTSQANVQSW